MERISPSKKPKVFYGYWIVLVAFLLFFIVGGAGYFAFSLFVRPLQLDLGWSRGEIMAAFTILFLITGLASPFTGKVVDRYGAKKVIAIGALLTGVGFIGLSAMRELWHFYISYAVIGAGMAAMGQIPATAIVSNWFQKKRGLAIGITSTGLGVGGFALAPLVGSYLIPEFGWRISYLALAILTVVLIIPLTLALVKTKPEDIGLYPDGLKTPDAIAVNNVSSAPASAGLTLRMALTIPAFWLINISFLASSFSHVGTVQSQVPYLEDAGFSVATAAAALGVNGLASAIGKFIFGWLCDRMPPKYAWTVGLVIRLACIVVLMNVGQKSPMSMIWLYSALAGLGSGAWLPTMSMLASTSFGLASYGAIFGVMSLFQNVGMGTGPLLAGNIYDATNSYIDAFTIFVVLYAVAIPAILALRRPKF